MWRSFLYLGFRRVLELIVLRFRGREWKEIEISCAATSLRCCPPATAAPARGLRPNAAGQAHDQGLHVGGHGWPPLAAFG